MAVCVGRVLAMGSQLIPGVTKLGPPIAWQIVGTFHNVHSADQRDPLPQMLIPFMQIPWPQAEFGVRTAKDPATTLARIAAAVHQVDPVVALSPSPKPWTNFATNPWPASAKRSRSLRALLSSHCFSPRSASTASCRFL
jgi:hypothetical protein